MLLYTESGIIKHLLTKDLPEAVICPLNLGSKERQLRNSDLFTTYAIVIVGFILAFAAFLFEVTRKLCDRQLGQPQKKIKKANKIVRWAGEPKLMWYSDFPSKSFQTSISSNEMNQQFSIYVNRILSQRKTLAKNN